jgi:hypothetical protein
MELDGHTYTLAFDLDPLCPVPKLEKTRTGGLHDDGQMVSTEYTSRNTVHSS